MRQATLLKSGTALLLPFVISACSDGYDSGATPPPPGPPPPAASIQSRIGANFASFFDASNTSDPREPTTADVPAVSVTAEPLDN